MKNRTIAILSTILAVLAAPTIAAPAQAAGQPRKPAPRVAKPAAAFRIAPSFTAPDIDGKSLALKSLRGKPLRLFFFCGCEWCHRFATAWAEVERSEAEPVDKDRANTHSAKARTVVVFMGDADNLRAFVRETGLDAARTRLIPDPRMDVTIRYQALECPRIFVLDREFHIRFTNNHKDDAPRKAAAATLVSKTIDALRNVTNAQTTDGPSPKRPGRVHKP